MRREPDCNACELPESRRSFIRDVMLTVGAALASSGVSAVAMAELPISALESLRDSVGTHTYPIPAADGTQIDRKNEIILVRWQNAVYAFNLACPHQNVALRWQEKEQRFKCPKHNSRYQPDGTFIDGRATRGLDRFNVKLDGTNIVVDDNAMHKQDADPTGWAAAVVHLHTP